MVGVRRLPSPPDDRELYWYFGPQKRWVLLCGTAVSVLTGISMLAFALRTPLLWAFLAVLAVNLVALVLTFANTLRGRRLTRGSHELLLRAWRPHRAPSVDLYLPTCGEPLDVLANAYRHVADVRWPGELTVWVLDDADRSQVAALAAEHGFRYVVRPDRGHLKKAGNLNHALTVSSAELIAVLDADFAPRPDFLHHLVPYFAEPDTGIVQSPQGFDTSWDMNWIERAAGAAQEWFFRWIQPSRDAVGAAICCGSNAVYRRGAIEAAGGFAKLEHSEDMYTGLELHRLGFRTRYVPVLLAKGTSPDTLSSFVNQQYRWALGNLRLLVSPDLPRAGAGWRMRLCFYEGIAGYIASLVNAFTAPLPPLVMMYAAPGQVRPWHVLPLLAPLWLWHVLLPRISKTHWRFEVIRAQLLVSASAGAALWHTLRGRSAGWVPTGAAARPGGMAGRVARGTALWLAASTAAAVVGLVFTAAQIGWAAWGIGLYVLVQCQLTLPLLRDLVRELRPADRARPAVRRPAAARPPRRWPEALATTAALLLIALLSTGWAAPLLS